MPKSGYIFSNSTISVSGVSIPFIGYMSKLVGEYGRRKRNSVTHNKITLNSPGYSAVGDPSFNSFNGVGTIGFNDDTCAKLYSLYEEQIDALVYEYMNSVYKRTYPIDLSFSLINFFIELKDLPSLINPAKAVNRNVKQMKRRSKALQRKKKSNRARRPSKAIVNQAIDDVASTYVGAQFGLIPTISDTTELTSRFSDLKSNFVSLRDKLRKQPRFRKKWDLALPPKRTSIGALSFDGPSWDTSKSYFTIVPGKTKLVVSGKVKYSCPDFESFGPLLSVLDRTGLRLDLSTVWNAIPFSWAVDWILPIGDALSAMAKPWLDIRSEVSGTYSVKTEFTVLYKGKASYIPGLPVDYNEGYAEITIYKRSLIPPDLSAFRPPPMPSFRADWNVKRAGILAGIAKGFKKL